MSRTHAPTPLPELEQQLLAAARRLDAAAAPSRRRRWLRGHLLVVFGATAVISAGVATGATLVLRGDVSPPASGPLPERASQPAGTTYRIRVVPQIQVGEVGWCSTLKLRRPQTRRWFGGSGCGPATRSTGMVMGGTTYFGSGRGLLAYAIVDRSVAYALTTDRPQRRLVPVSDPHLPNGWRAIVQLPGESHTGNLRFRDPQGRPAGARRSGAQALQIPRLPTRAALGATPAAAPCTLSLPEGSVARGSRWATRLAGVSGLPARALRACTQTRFTWRGSWAEATVLVDAAEPGTALPLDLLPLGSPTEGLAGAAELGLVSMPGSFGEEPRLPVGVPLDAHATVLRQGNAWIAIRARSAQTRHKLARLVRVRVG